MEQLIFPYLEGNVLLLLSDRSHCFRSKIVKFYQPSTLSCVMEVDIELRTGQMGRFILKLYDPRYATSLRQQKKAGPFDLAKETAYCNFVNNGDAWKFLANPRIDPDEPKSLLEVAQKEVYLHSVCQRFFERECVVYNRLKDRQGQDIPRLMAKVRLPTTPSAGNGRPGDFYEIKGIVLELIDGFTLQYLLYRVPRGDWQKTCDEVIRIVQMCDEHEILNSDVRTSNFMVAPLPSGNAYRVVMIDFALARLRGSGESDLNWGRCKWKMDEERIIGAVMQHGLKRAGFDLVYEPSGRYDEWAPREVEDDVAP